MTLGESCRYDLWFPTDEWHRVREFLSRLDWDDAEQADLKSGTHVPLWLPSLTGYGGVVLAWPESDGPHVSHEGWRNAAAVVGKTVTGPLTHAPGWHDWTFARYVIGHTAVQTADPESGLPEPTWAAVCAHLRVPAYVEVGLADSDDVTEVYAISVSGEVRRQAVSSGASEAARHRFRTAALLGDDSELPIPVALVEAAATTSDDEMERLVAARRLAADVANWRDASSASAQAWSGDDIDAMLTRAERGIVAYDDVDLHAAEFLTAIDLQARLDEVLGSSPIRLTAYDLDADRFEAEHSRHGTLRMRPHRAWLPTPNEGVSTEQAVLAEAHVATPDIDVDESGVSRTWIPHLMAPWLGDGWWSALKGPVDVRPSLSVVADGPVIRRLHAEACTDIDRLRPYVGRFDVQPLPPRERWFVLHLEGTPTALMFPRTSTMLQIHLDGDGSSLYLQLVHDTVRLEELRRLLAFRRRWADWLDDDHEFTPEQLAAGVRDVELRLVQALDEEVES